MTYRLHRDSGVILVATDEHIPPVKSDARWRDYQSWVKAGNVPEPAIIPESEPGPGPGVPAEVTMRQARLALLQAGVLAGVDAAIDSMPEPHRSAARIEWEYAQAVERNSDLTLMMGAALGLDGSAIDAIFMQAAGL